MIELLAIIVAGFVWAFLAGELTTFNLLVGIVLGILLSALIGRRREHSLPRRLVAFVVFLVAFVKELVVANIVISLLALRPRPRFYPHIIAVPLTLRSDQAITLLSLVITLLPGTVAMGVSEDKSELYAHAITDPDVARARENVLRMERLIEGFLPAARTDKEG